MLTGTIKEPRVPADLEMIDDTLLPVKASEYYPAILRVLAKQLGVRSDFYYPLLGAAEIISDSDEPR